MSLRTRHCPGGALAFLLAVAGALAGCAGGRPPPPPRDAELASATTAARLAFARGLYEQSASLYGRALARANVTDDPRSISDAAYNLAACLVPLGRYAAADELLDEAEAEAARAGLPAAHVVLLRGRVAVFDGRPGDAVAMADRLVADGSLAADGGDRAQAQVIRGEAALAAGEIAAAAAAAEAARREARLVRDPAVGAQVLGLKAAVALASRGTGGQGQAAALFGRQADLLGRAKLYGDMSAALARAAAAYAAGGEARRAADHYYRAARSAAGRGDGPAARALATAAESAAESAGDETTARRARRLLRSAAPPSTAPASMPVRE